MCLTLLYVTVSVGFLPMYVLNAGKPVYTKESLMLYQKWVTLGLILPIACSNNMLEKRLQPQGLHHHQPQLACTGCKKQPHWAYSATSSKLLDPRQVSISLVKKAKKGLVPKCSRAAWMQSCQNCIFIKHCYWNRKNHQRNHQWQATCSTTNKIYVSFIACPSFHCDIGVGNVHSNAHNKQNQPAYGWSFHIYIYDCICLQDPFLKNANIYFSV